MKLKTEHALLAGTVLATLVAALLLIRWLAPQLLGVPADLRLVSVAKELPPFFEGVFRPEEPAEQSFILQDPVARVRAKPFLDDRSVIGPHDLLGFRNFAIPRTADIVVIGDSQTYGNNARLEDNWPSQMAGRLAAKQPVVYAMATGGWAAAQYLQMVPYALRLRPRTIVVAFYSGNDAAESFVMAYGNDLWESLRPNRSLKPADMPAMAFRPSEDAWPVTLPGGGRTVFTPRLRLLANDVSHPAVKAGWDVMGEAVRRMASQAQAAKVPLLVVMIPTKELVYEKLIVRARLPQPAAYAKLVALEAANIARFGAQVQAAGAAFVDTTPDLQEAAVNGAELYPEDENGHPYADGYTVIANRLASAVDPSLPARPQGLFVFKYNLTSQTLFLLNDEGAWTGSPEMLRGNGWPAGTFPTLEERDLATFPMKGPIPAIDKRRFGPRASGR